MFDVAFNITEAGTIGLQSLLFVWKLPWNSYAVKPGFLFLGENMLYTMFKLIYSGYNQRE